MSLIRIAVCVIGMCDFMVNAGSERNLTWLQDKCPSGAALVYQRGGSVHDSPSDIILIEVATGSQTTITNGSQPEFSPDGSKLAWISDTSAYGCMRTNPSIRHCIAKGVKRDAGVHWISNTEVVVVVNNAWHRVNIGSGAMVTAPELTALGSGGPECDVKLGSDGVWSYVSGTTWKTSDGNSGSIGPCCSGSLSPDGKSVTGLNVDHRSCRLTEIRTGGYNGMISISLTSCGSKGFDNQRWSSNDPRFVVCQYECLNRIGVWEVGTSDVVLLGDCLAESYGDFTNGSGMGDPWPTPVAVPATAFPGLPILLAVLIATGMVGLSFPVQRNGSKSQDSCSSGANWDN